MSNKNHTVTVKRYIILKNFWEYYIIEEDAYNSIDDSLPPKLYNEETFKRDIQYAYVMGDFDEFGNVNLAEIKPYIVGDTVNLRRDEIAPPIGWKWID